MMRRMDMFDRSRGERWTAPAILVSLLALLACGDDGGGPGVDDPTPQSLTASGWEAFEAGNWTGALANFGEAVGLDSTYGEALEGRGWALARLDSIEASAAAFGEAVDAGRDSASTHAGLAAVLRDRSPADYSGAIDAARAALLRDGGFRFAHDPSFDWSDLRLIVAQSCFALGRYTEANQEVVLLGGSAANPSADTFVEDLMAEIERLSGVVSD
jgi:tetratricopeptide (TPR) repeat protein